MLAGMTEKQQFDLARARSQLALAFLAAAKEQQWTKADGDEEGGK